MDQDPNSTIQVLAGFSILEAHRLGWDTTMKLYVPRDNLCILPYANFFDIRRYGGSIYHTHWIISMPRKDAEGKDEEFVTVKCISAVGAENICGRAVLVWEALRFTERHNPKQVCLDYFTGLCTFSDLF